MGHIRALLPGEAFDTYLAAIGAATDFDAPDTPAAETRTTEQRTADAFIDMIDAALAAGDLSTTAGVKPHLTVTGTVETLTQQDDTAGTTQYGTRLSAETVRRIAFCDAGLTRAILGATGQALDIGRETRQWSVAQHRAAAVAFGGCAFPVAAGEACGRPMGWSDLHHVRYWRDGGHTNIDNAVPLCRRHHVIVHRDDHDLNYEPTSLTVTLTRTLRDGREATRQVSFATTPRPVEPDRLSL